LTADRQSHPVTDATVTLDVFQPSDILLNLAAQRPLDGV
jgi:hypothetical protein